MGVPSHYKVGLILLLLVASCAEESESYIETRGIDIDTDNVFVDAVSVDSMLFASGKKHYRLKGLIVSDGLEHSYALIYNDYPFDSKSELIASTPPGCILPNSEVEVLLTKEAEKLMISWRTPHAFLWIKTVLTSER